MVIPVEIIMPGIATRSRTTPETGASKSSLSGTFRLRLMPSTTSSERPKLRSLSAPPLAESPSSLLRYSTFAAAISSSAPLVGFLCRLSTRAAAPRLSWRERLAASTTSKYRFETLFNAFSSDGNAINSVPPGRVG